MQRSKSASRRYWNYLAMGGNGGNQTCIPISGTHCNRVNGSYKIGSSTLTIELGASTMAFCGEQSVDQKFLESLRNVASYTIENDQLVLILKNDAGRMAFNK
jgi:heat shock protein HslJ